MLLSSILSLLLCFSPLNVYSSSGCNPVDLSALLAFKSSISSDPSGLLTNWNSTTDCCAWNGIVCDSITGRVVNLNLPGGDSPTGDASLAGTISPSIGNLTHLTVLDLSSLQQLSGPIPSSLGHLTLLTTLFLDSNNLTGPIPSTLGNLVNLQKLYLSSNQLSAPIPPPLFSSPYLLELGLSGNALSGPIPATIGHLKRLQKVDLNTNKLSGSIPYKIGMLSQLTYLDFSANQLSGSVPQSIGNLVRLNLNLLSQPKPTLRKHPVLNLRHDLSPVLPLERQQINREPTRFNR